MPRLLFTLWSQLLSRPWVKYLEKPSPDLPEFMGHNPSAQAGNRQKWPCEAAHAQHPHVLLIYRSCDSVNEHHMLQLYAQEERDVHQAVGVFTRTDWKCRKTQTCQTASKSIALCPADIETPGKRSRRGRVADLSVGTAGNARGGEDHTLAEEKTS